MEPLLDDDELGAVVVVGGGAVAVELRTEDVSGEDMGELTDDVELVAGAVALDDAATA